MDYRILLLLGTLGLGAYAACSVYDPSLVTGSSGSNAGGASASGSSSSSASSAGGDSSASSSASGTAGGSPGQCVNGTDCPGMDEPCKTRTCNAGVCGVDFTKQGTSVSGPGPGGCAVAVCNGQGAVECVGDQCGDKTQNGTETDVDCGGLECAPCDIGKKCDDDNDCVSQTCTSDTCQTSCSDDTKNGSETDKDCGGGTCPACATGKLCVANGDCLSGKCNANACVDVLLISEVRTRGLNGGNDDFVEIYNPSQATVTFDSSWSVTARSAAGGCTGQSAERFKGGGQVILPHQHLLFTNSMGYKGVIPGDGTYDTGITDAAEVVLHHGAAIVDALCFFFDAATQKSLLTCMPKFQCEGTPANNAPHNDSGGPMSNIDVSLERRPGGVIGNQTDTGNNADDFLGSTPANPQNLASPLTPP